MTDKKKLADAATNDQTGEEEQAVAKPTVPHSGGEDIANFRLPQNFVAAVAVAEHTDAVPVRSPDRTWWFRTRVEEQWPAFVLKLDGGEWYLVTPALAPVFEGAAKPRMLTACITRENQVFVWAISMPDVDGRSSLWGESAMAAAKRASKTWVRVTPDMAAGYYRVSTVPEQGGFVDVEPAWPKLSMDQIVRTAFKDRIISDAQHPVVQRFLGKA